MVIRSLFYLLGELVECLNITDPLKVLRCRPRHIVSVSLGSVLIGCAYLLCIEFELLLLTRYVCAVQY